MRRLLKTLSHICILTLAFQGSIAFAWGSDGHKIVAMLAEAQLSPAARKEVERLLAQEPGATLASISTWADEHRNPATAAWHYVNFPRGDCNYQPERDCPDGKCVVAAIDRQIEVLRTPGDDEKRLTALKYVVHFIGDIYQPLHAGLGMTVGVTASRFKPSCAAVTCTLCGTPVLSSRYNKRTNR